VPKKDRAEIIIPSNECEVHVSWGTMDCSGFAMVTKNFWIGN